MALLTLYPAIFYREQNDAFSVIFPDLDHLATDGETLEEAMEMAIDCLAGYVYSSKRDGESLPEPTPVEKVDIHCEDDEDFVYLSAFVNIVAVDVKEYAAKHFEKPVKKTLTVPEWLNKRAIEMNVNFSVALKNRLISLCSSPERAKSFVKDSPANLLAKLFADRPFAIGAPVPFLGLVADSVPDAVSEKNVKKTLTLPKWLNEKALAMDINFSAVLRDALFEACQNKIEDEKNNSL